MLLALLLMIGCPESASPSLVGKWQRVGDDAAGTIVQVEKGDKGYVGKLVVVFGRLQLIGFKIGELKWKDIEYVDGNRWEGLDSTKIFVGPLLYDNTAFTLYENGRFLRVEAFNHEPGENGAIQRWKRVP